MTRSTLLLPKGIEELIASCWVLKGKCTFFFSRKKTTNQAAAVDWYRCRCAVCCTGGRGQLHSPPKPNIWDRIMQVMMPINQRAAASISEERCYLSIFTFDHKSRQASQPLQPLFHCFVIHPKLLTAENHNNTLLPSGIHRPFCSWPF